jgi:hypothetical protein
MVRITNSLEKKLSAIRPSGKLTKRPSTDPFVFSGSNQEEVEDIFHDWVRMLLKADIRINADINDVFWCR